MFKMTINLDNKGLKSIAHKFDLFFIDIWGVVHDGISLFEDSINVLNELQNLKKEYILLTNAPRPNATVINFLKKLWLAEQNTKIPAMAKTDILFIRLHLKKINKEAKT